MTQSANRNKLALQQIYAKLNQDQAALGLAVASYKRISESLLFDPTYYKARYPDIERLGLEPLAHYVLHGASEARSSHPLFDGQYYSKAVSCREPRVRNFLRDYLEFGKNNPNPLFDTEFYLSQTGLIHENPLEHFLKSGHSLSTTHIANPFPLFDTRYYLEENADVQEAGLNPLSHFLVLGAYEGRSPHPLFSSEYYLRMLGVEPVPRFDLSNPIEMLKRFYKHAFTYVWDDQAPRAVNPLLHYLEFGAIEKRNPHPIFSAKQYLERYPDVSQTDLNPLVHYVLYGEKEKRRPHLLFDPDFYLSQVSDKREEAEQHALTHYCLCGWRLRLAPHPAFDTRIYLDLYSHQECLATDPLSSYLINANKLERQIPNGWFDGEFYANYYPDLDETGLTPLEHYLQYGAKENRARNFFDSARKLGINHGFDEAAAIPKDVIFNATADVAASVVVFGSANEDECLRSLASLSRHGTTKPFELVFVAQGKEIEVETLRRQGVKVLQFSDCANFGSLCKQIGEIARGEHIIFLRKNMQVLEGWLDSLLFVFAAYPNVGVAYSQILTPLGRVKTAGYQYDGSGKVRRRNAFADGFCTDIEQLTEVEFGPRDSVAVQKKALMQMKLYESAPYPRLIEDALLAYAIRESGWAVVCYPVSKVVALGEYTTVSQKFDLLPPEEIQTFERYILTAGVKD